MPDPRCFHKWPSQYAKFTPVYDGFGPHHYKLPRHRPNRHTPTRKLRTPE